MMKSATADPIETFEIFTFCGGATVPYSHSHSLHIRDRPLKKSIHGCTAKNPTRHLCSMSVSSLLDSTKFKV